jgi:hypothetical protein
MRITMIMRMKLLLPTMSLMMTIMMITMLLLMTMKTMTVSMMMTIITMMTMTTMMIGISQHTYSHHTDGGPFGKGPVPHHKFSLCSMV